MKNGQYVPKFQQVYNNMAEVRVQFRSKYCVQSCMFYMLICKRLYIPIFNGRSSRLHYLLFQVPMVAG